MKRRTLRTISAAAVLGVPAAFAAAAPQHLLRIDPAGAQRGTELEVHFRGTNIKDAQEVIAYEPGITVTKVEAVSATDVKVALKIAADCPLGEHRLRLRTARGWTELRDFYVGTLPVVIEKEPNSDFANPQKVDLNVTVEGIVENEDVDYYLLDAKKGQRITAEIEGIRLGHMFDPYIAILDRNRFELASADDTALLNQDGFVSVIAPADGPYVVMVRESAYGGNARCHYRLHIGDLPRPTAIYPPGGEAGKELKFQFIGDKSGPIPGSITLPQLAAGGPPAALPWRSDLLGVWAEQAGHVAPSPNWVRVSSFPTVLETEPNNDREHATAATMAPPLAFTGVIGQPGDEDWFSFTAKKGEVLELQVLGRALRSPLDSVLDVFNEKGKHLGGNDDKGENPDSQYRFNVPADGKYFVLIRDHLRAGGESYVYRLEVTPVSPRLALRIPEVARNDTQTRQWIAVPRGGRFVTLIQATRSEFGAPLKFTADDLPQGVKLVAPVMAQSTNQAPLVFEAAADAPVAGRLSDLRAEDADGKAHVTGRYQNSVELVQGEPNNTAYYITETDRIPVAVVQELPFAVNIVEPKVPLVQSGSLKIKITAQRKDGFKAPIHLYWMYRPSGLGTNYEVTLPEGATEVDYPLNATGNAAVGEWPMAVLARAEVEGTTVYSSTQLATLKIDKPLLTGEIPIAAGEQGQTIEVVVKLNVVRPFDGEGTLTLEGLPAHCTTTPAKVKKDTKEVVFKVQTTAEAPPGQQKSLFCQFTLNQGGEEIVQSLARGGVLRIDKPRPAPVAKPAAAQPGKPAAAPAPAPAEAKRLSRLEQLRLEAQQRAKAGGK